jgi:type I restriction enzyme, S subunit
MIGDLKPYPSMRESGVPWLGKVPDHWSVLPNRALFAEIKDRNHPDEEMLSVTITKGVVKQKELLADSSKKDSSNLDRSAYKLVQPRDIAYNKMRAWQGAIGASDYRGIISPAYVVMRLRGDPNPRYFHHLYRTPQFAKEAERWSYGITSDMWSLRPEHFRLIYSLLPPPEEQDAIVQFVDYADRRIRSYIRIKQKLVKLLEEQKQAIIHNAVTRGIDPNARLTPSGIDWLGSVPQDWTVMPLKRAFRSMDYGISESGSDDGAIRLLAMGDIRSGKVRVPESGGVHTVDEALLLRPDDLLFNRTNSAELVGKVGLFSGAATPVTFASYLVRLRPKPQNVSEYLNYLLNEPYFLQRVRREAIPSLHQSNLNPTRYGRFPLPLPPPEQQRSIVQYLKNDTAGIDNALNQTAQQIRLLQALQVRLIADVITGKRDVRDALEKLPREIQKPSTTADAGELANEGEEAIEGNDVEVAEEAET